MRTKQESRQLSHPIQHEAPREAKPRPYVQQSAQQLHLTLSEPPHCTQVPVGPGQRCYKNTSGPRDISPITQHRHRRGRACRPQTSRGSPHRARPMTRTPRPFERRAELQHSAVNWTSRLLSPSSDCCWGKGSSCLQVQLATVHCSPIDKQPRSTPRDLGGVSVVVGP